MKTYSILINKDQCHSVVKIKAHNVAEAVSKFKERHRGLTKGWTLLDRTHPHDDEHSWRFDRHKVRSLLNVSKDEINSVWVSHEEVSGSY